MLVQPGAAHPAEAIRRALAERRPVEVVAAYDCMTALVAQQIGFDGIVVGAGSIANFSYGVPDIGLLDLPEALEVVRRMCDCVNIAVFADVDDAGESPMHVRRTVQLAEYAGAAGIMVEDTDSTGPKLLWNEELGNWDWQAARLHPPEVGAARIRRVVGSRRDPRFMVMARTDSLRVQPELGLEGALERVRLYVDAGADVVYVLGQVEEQVTREIVGSVPVPIVFAKPGGIDEREREHLRGAGIDFLFHALVPQLSAYQAFKRTVVSLKAGKRAELDGAPWDVNKELLETIDLRGWTQLLREERS